MKIYLKSVRNRLKASERLHSQAQASEQQNNQYLTQKYTIKWFRDKIIQYNI